MSNGDDAMTSAEFAKLMGAYPEPSGNPLPAYGGYMDNSAANFSWVNNNDYFSAEGIKVADCLGCSHQYPLEDMNKYGLCEECQYPTGSEEESFNAEGKPRVKNITNVGEKVIVSIGDDIYEGSMEDVMLNDYTNSRGQEITFGAEEYDHVWDVPLDKYEEVFGMTNEEILEKFPDLEVDDYKRCLMAMRKNAETFEAERIHVKCECGTTIGTDEEIYMKSVPFEVIDNEDGSLGYKVVCTNCAKSFYDAETFEARAETTGQPTRLVVAIDTSGSTSMDYKGRMGETKYPLLKKYETMARQMAKTMNTDEFIILDWNGHGVTHGPRKGGDSLEAYNGTGSIEMIGKWLQENGVMTGEYIDTVVIITDGIVREFSFKYAETFEAPYGGAGSLMDIGKSTPLENFTDEELTTSSAIHGDFDQASLNYSGHQNLEVKAEMDIVAEGMAVISNKGQDIVGVVEAVDDEDDDEMVELSIQDENMEEIGSFTLDDGHLMDDYDDYHFAESKTPSLLTLGIGAVAAILAFPYLKEGVRKVFSADNDIQEVLENDPEVIENPDTGDLDPAQYEELVVESTGYALDIIPMGLDGSFMGSRFAALPTERYVDYNDPGIGAHTDIALNRDETFLEPEMAMVQAAEGDTVVKETQAPGQSPYFQMGEEPVDMNYRVIHETSPISLDPAVKPFIPQSMTGYTGNKNTPPSVYNKMFNLGVLGQTPLFTPQDAGDIGASRAGSRRATPDVLGLNGSVGGPLSDKVNANYTDGTTSMSLAQWAIENTVSQSSDTEAVVIDRSSGAMKRVRRV